MGCNSGGYLIIRIDDVLYRACRLAWLYMTGEWPKGDVDHKDRNKANNKWANLRDATQSQNQANTTARASCQSGLKGAYPHGQNPGRWTGQIKHNGKTLYLGSFDTPEEAHAAYRIKALELFGEFARFK